MDDYVKVNLAHWNSRVSHHLRGYGIERFQSDPDHLTHVVRFDLPRLGSIKGLDVLHLQCHIGTDTLSLARLGPSSVTGIDFSRPALDAAAALATACGAEITYVESEVYSAVDTVGPERFDLVYTGIGSLGWLPDIGRWAQTVSALLRPGGRLFIREGHPVLLALDDPRPDGLLVLSYPYFETQGVHFSESFSYVDHDEPLTSPDLIHFNHGLGEIVTSLLDVGLRITSLEEHDTAPWNPLGDATEEVSGGEYRLRENPERLPMTYTLQAVKVTFQGTNDRG